MHCWRREGVRTLTNSEKGGRKEKERAPARKERKSLFLNLKGEKEEKEKRGGEL